MEDVEFRQKLQRYKDTVYRIAYTYLRNQADAEDVSQDTFLKLYLREVPFPDDGAGRGECGLNPAASRRFRFEFPKNHFSSVSAPSSFYAQNIS